MIRCDRNLCGRIHIWPQWEIRLVSIFLGEFWTFSSFIDGFLIVIWIGENLCISKFNRSVDLKSIHKLSSRVSYIINNYWFCLKFPTSSFQSIKSKSKLSFEHKSRKFLYKFIIFCSSILFYFYLRLIICLCVLGCGACAAFWLQGPLPAESSPIIQYCHDSANQEYNTQSLALQSLRENAREHVTNLKQQHRNQTICEVNNNTSNYQLNDDVIMHTVDKYAPLSRPTTLAIPGPTQGFFKQKIIF